jgi:hypothetical protein
MKAGTTSSEMHKSVWRVVQIGHLQLPEGDMFVILVSYEQPITPGTTAVICMFLVLTISVPCGGERCGRYGSSLRSVVG